MMISAKSRYALRVMVDLAQHMVDVILGKRKSRGCMRYILCFIYGLDLFRFGEEQV